MMHPNEIELKAMSPTVGAHVCRAIAGQVRKAGKVNMEQIVTMCLVLCGLYPDAKPGDPVPGLTTEGVTDTPQGFARYCELIADRCEAAAEGGKA